MTEEDDIAAITAPLQQGNPSCITTHNVCEKKCPPQKKPPNITTAFDVMMKSSSKTKTKTKGEKRKEPSNNNIIDNSNVEKSEWGATTIKQKHLSNPNLKSLTETFMPSSVPPPNIKTTTRSTTIITQKRRVVVDPINDDDDDPYNLRSRFIDNQKKMFNKALSEIRQGYKRSCWLWFILPTTPYVDLNGIEKGSKRNRYYALRGCCDGIENNNNNNEKNNGSCDDDHSDFGHHQQQHDDAVRAYLQYPTQEFHNIIQQQQQQLGEEEEEKTQQQKATTTTTTITTKVNLRKNYLKISKAILYQMEYRGSTLQSLFGKIDMPKVKCSLQLFHRVCASSSSSSHNNNMMVNNNDQHEEHHEIATICDKILSLDNNQRYQSHRKRK